MRYMRSTTHLVMLVSVAISVVAAQNHPKDRQKVLMNYELYSWQESKGNWEFSILPNLERYYVIEEVLDKRRTIHGVDRLKLRLSQLPAGTTVYWLDRLSPDVEPKHKIRERFGYPPPDVVEEIQKYAGKRKIKIEVFGGQDG